MPTNMAGNKDSASSPPDGSSSSTRLMRNLAEKQRRDKLNGYISELATIVPMVSMASKRLDKTSILRLSAAHLRISQSFLGKNRKRTKGSFKWRPNHFTASQIREILESVEGFLLVITTNGKIMYVSHSVEKFLGHQNIEMIGHSIYSFVHPSDSDMVRDQLQSLTVSQKNGTSEPSRCSFYCRLRERNQPRSEVLTYQFVHLVGHMNNEYEEDEEVEVMEDDGKQAKVSSPLNPVLKAFVRVVHSNPYNELSLSDAIENEYVTRHSPNGTIIFADHRLSTITGHLPHEVYGMSAYEYIKVEDTSVAYFAHKLMLTSNGGTGVVVYRLRTRNDSLVYLKSTGYVQFGKSASQIDHFICVNKQLSDEEGEKELKRFRERFTPHIRDTCSASILETLKSIQNNNVVTEKPDMKPTQLLPIKQIDAISLEPPPAEEMEYGEPKLLQNKSNRSISGLGSVPGPPSKRMAEKISLETDLAGRITSNCSPLTDSSLSANSPHSEELYEPVLSLEATDSIYVSNLSPVLNGSHLLSSVGDTSVFSLEASPLPMEVVLQITSANNVTDDLDIIPMVDEDLSDPASTFWQASLDPSDFPSELSLETPPYSSGEETSKNAADSGC